MIPGLVLIFIFGCQSDPLNTIIPKTIEQTIKTSLVSSQPEIAIIDFQVLSTQNTGKGTLVIYRYTDQRTIEININPVDSYNIGMALVRQIKGEWVIEINKASGTNRIPQHIIYDTVDIETESVTFGQVLDSDAASIMIMYTDGTILTKAIDHQTFIMNAPVGVTIKDLRVLGSDNDMIYSYKDKGNKLSD